MVRARGYIQDPLKPCVLEKNQKKFYMSLSASRLLAKRAAAAGQSTSVNTGNVSTTQGISNVGGSAANGPEEANYSYHDALRGHLMAHYGFERRKKSSDSSSSANVNKRIVIGPSRSAQLIDDTTPSFYLLGWLLIHALDRRFLGYFKNTKPWYQYIPIIIMSCSLLGFCIYNIHIAPWLLWLMIIDIIIPAFLLFDHATSTKPVHSSAAADGDNNNTNQSTALHSALEYGVYFGTGIGNFLSNVFFVLLILALPMALLPTVVSFVLNAILLGLVFYYEYRVVEILNRAINHPKLPRWLSWYVVVGAMILIMFGFMFWYYRDVWMAFNHACFSMLNLMVIAYALYLYAFVLMSTVSHGFAGLNTAGPNNSYDVDVMISACREYPILACVAGVPHLVYSLLHTHYITRMIEKGLPGECYEKLQTTLNTMTKTAGNRPITTNDRRLLMSLRTVAAFIKLMVDLPRNQKDIDRAKSTMMMANILRQTQLIELPYLKFPWVAELLNKANPMAFDAFPLYNQTVHENLNGIRYGRLIFDQIQDTRHAVRKYRHNQASTSTASSTLPMLLLQ